MAHLLACIQCICIFPDIIQRSGVVCLLSHVTPGLKWCNTSETDTWYSMQVSLRRMEGLTGIHTFSPWQAGSLVWMKKNCMSLLL